MASAKAIRVLYMEDDPGLARLLKWHLRDRGYTVDLAKDGEQGITMYRNAPYDVVVVDYQMPGKTGIDAIRALSSEDECPPIVMLTGAGNESVAVEAMKLGATDYVIKDVENRYQELLPAVMERALEHCALRREKRHAEEALRQAHDELEQRVIERTAELARANENLKLEITERIRAQASIQKQHQFLNSVLESLTHPFYVIDALNYSVTMANKACGFPDSPGPVTCHRLTHGKETPCNSALHGCPLDEVKATGKPAMAHHIHYDETGRLRNLELHAYPVFDSSGQVAQVIEYSLDVTERVEAQAALQESEERFRTIVDSAGDCVFIKDRSHRYTFVNPAMTQLFGMHESEILGKTDEDIFGGDAGTYLREVDSRVLSGERIEEQHTRMVNGSRLTFLDIRVPMIVKGKIIGVCGIDRNITDRKEREPLSGVVHAEGHLSKAMRLTIEKALLAAGTDCIVLVTGESGSGKDFLARFIHDNSKRADGPYFSINCAAVAAELAESELFGHEAGAFTGANRRKRGLLELAEGGTLLLNEIGELSLRLQAKLLTFLDTRTFTRVGGEKNVTVNARLIAATNRNLEQEVSDGKFRQDLFYRLNVFSITVPPLRERQEDIPVLIRSISAQLAAEMQLESIPEIDAATMERFCSYAWPGNVRELRNVLERSLILSGRGPLMIDLGAAKENHGSDRFWTASFPPARPLTEMAEQMKRSFIAEALQRSKGQKTAAAKILKITRASLKSQMKTLGLSGPE